MAKSNRKHSGKITTKQAFLRLKKGKGSVLFLVVAIMSVMVILASAVYYSVTAARKQVEVKYDSQQAYQSALALNDLVIDFINIKNDDAFVKSIIDLNQNESLVTKSGDGTGFSELAGGLGNYKVTVKKVKGDASDEIHVLEIEVDIDVNGEKSTISTVGEFQVKTKPYNFDRFFTSTGYAPKDVIFKNMKNENETIYLDNEYTQFGGADAGDVTTKSAELISAGTVRFESPSMVQTTGLTIGNNCYVFGHNGFSFPIARIGGTTMLLTSAGNLGGGPMYILGDFYSAHQASNEAIYVNGDMVYTNQNNPGKKIYVNGDLFIHSGNNPNSGDFVVGGNIYYYGEDGRASGYLKDCKGNVYNIKSNTVFYQSGATALINSGNVGEFDANKIYFNLASSTNYDTEEEIRKKLDYIEAYCSSGTGGYTNVWPSLNGTCEDIVTVKQRINEKIGNPEYINWDLEDKFIKTETVDDIIYESYAVDDSKLLNLTLDQNGGTVIKATTDNDYYVVQSVTGGGNRSSIIFDTFMGDYNNPSEVADKTMYANMYVYLEPNCYVAKDANGNTILKTDDPTKFDCFSWDTTEGGSGVKFILTRGMGSVNFVVPEGVRYIQPQNGYLGHIAMFETMTNSSFTVNNNNGTLTYGSAPLDRMPTGVEGNIRNNLVTNDMGTSHVLNPNLIAKYNNANDPAKAYFIHNNVFLVTISKNAIMDFSGGQNLLAGFIYAPYMTYNSEGIYAQAQSGMIGGMIVSDFIQSAANDNYVCMLPYDYYDRYVNTSGTAEKQEEDRTRYMEKLMADSGCTQILSSSTSRTWRKYGYN